MGIIKIKMKFIIASVFALAATEAKRLSAYGVGDGLEIGFQHPVDRWEQNKIDNIFRESFNTVPRGDSEWVSSGPAPFKVASAVPSVSY